MKKKTTEVKVIKSVSKAEEKIDTSIEGKLKALYKLQQIDSKVDKIRTVRGELPLEVQDLEDEVEGLETRVQNYTDEANALLASITEKKSFITECKALIKKYETQLKNVRNNREYDSLTKEIEYQNLEIQLAEKRIKENKANIEAKNEVIEKSNKIIRERKSDLKVKKAELDDIITETEKEEHVLLSESKSNERIIEEMLLNAYKRIRKNARNGLAVVTVERDACGGCFNKIPPQRQLEIRQRKKIIVCEYCGRVLVDPIIAGTVKV
ncbi:MAG: C4-type zinc ribbon domain-containing protein [Bacteroidales bacterium]|nr:C4-type zinc ribbon domain-containing protein [Bacteroidales bacterium]